jgi:hypothetical protein
MLLRSRTFILLLGTWLTLAGLMTFAEAKQKPAQRASGITVSGCLQKGYVLDRFLLRSPSGKAYALRSVSVNLSEHVGHKVTINGKLSRDPKRDDYEFEGSEVNEEYGKDILDLLDVEVTSLKTVSASCSASSGK